MSKIKLFGIRHHGSGSARRMMHALEEWKPDCICVELPYEAQEFFPFIQTNNVLPPFAILFCNQKKVDQSFYLPMAVFSPEYQAILFASKNNIPIYAIDLPAKYSLIQSNFRKQEAAMLNYEQQHMVRDPIGYLAKRAGYKDSERWWDLYMEQWTDDITIFDHVFQLMKILREQSLESDDSETLYREIFMRNQIRLRIHEGKEKIAVVCGAWHAPVLDEAHIVNKKDEKIALAEVATMSTLIPWNYKRLTLNSQYSAGVISPIWNEFLFTDNTQAPSKWLSFVAHALRKKGYEISLAEVIDATLFSNQMAYLRKLILPGLDEMIEAATTVFGQGNSIRIDQIKNEIIIGYKQGKIEVSALSFPIQKEFLFQLKVNRLIDFWQRGHKDELHLDLRKELHLGRSRFLHATCLLNLQWAQLDRETKSSHSNFHENWTFNWTPELEIELIKIAFYGNTIQEAAENKLKELFQDKKDLVLLVDSLEHIFKSGFVDLGQLVLDEIKMYSLETNSVLQWIEFIRPLYSTMEYGNLHQYSAESISDLFQFLVPRIIIQLPMVSHHISDEEAEKLIVGIVQIDIYLQKWKENSLISLFEHALYKLVKEEQSHPILAGRASALLMEKNSLAVEELVEDINYRFLASYPVANSLKWLSGFIYQSSGFQYISDKIITVIQTWVTNMNEDNFKQNLPILRRIFGPLAKFEQKRFIDQITTKITIDKKVEMGTLWVSAKRKKWILDIWSPRH